LSLEYFYRCVFVFATLGARVKAKQAPISCGWSKVWGGPRGSASPADWSVVSSSAESRRKPWPQTHFWHILGSQTGSSRRKNATFFAGTGLDGSNPTPRSKFRRPVRRSSSSSGGLNPPNLPLPGQIEHCKPSR